jgi:hypothetical protein
MLRQERFQDTLRERLDFRSTRDARINNGCQAVSVPASGPRQTISNNFFDGRNAQKREK